MTDPDSYHLTLEKYLKLGGEALEGEHCPVCDRRVPHWIGVAVEMQQGFDVMSMGGVLDWSDIDVGAMRVLGRTYDEAHARPQRRLWARIKRWLWP